MPFNLRMSAHSPFSTILQTIRDLRQANVASDSEDVEPSDKASKKHHLTPSHLVSI